MQVNFGTEKVDEVLMYCLDNFPDKFYGGLIMASEDKIVNDDVTLGAILHYISVKEPNVLIDLGYGNDNVHYYILGPQAASFMKDGGFKHQEEQRKKNEKLDQDSKQATIEATKVSKEAKEEARKSLISSTLTATIAIILSVVFFIVDKKDDKIKQLQTEIDSLKHNMIKLQMPVLNSSGLPNQNTGIHAAPNKPSADYYKNQSPE
ncbi:MAG: hypothetical protein JWR67_753 [Mucilaginibacter sp.]|nr:hypothetical protein [Mucilaginibacter sp.]